MQMPACLLCLFIMETLQLTFVIVSPLGTRIILLEIHLYVVPHKMQANDFELIPYFKYTSIKYAISL